MENKNKVNKKIMVAIIALLAIIVAAIVSYFVFKPQPAVEDSLLTGSSNPEATSLGLILINNGAINPDDASEFNESQYNFFEDAGLPTISSPAKVYSMNSPGDENFFLEKVTENFSLFNASFVEPIVKTETLFSGDIKGFQSDGAETLFSVFVEPYKPLSWSYSNSNFVAASSVCPLLDPPGILNFLRKSPEEMTSSGGLPNPSTLSDAELDQWFFMDAYNLALEEYEELCNANVSVNLNVAEQEAKDFLQKLDFDTTTLSYVTLNDNENSNIIVTAYQNIGREQGPEVAKILVNYENKIMSASGISYILEERAVIETLSPSESMERTLQTSRIVGSINPNYFEEYNLITTTSPKTDKTVYEMNRSKDIIVTIATIDGYLIVPGYILYNNTDKTGIYTVAVPQKYFEATQ